MYVTQNHKGSWELRQSERTAAGPRSRTLATFRALDVEAIDRAVVRSGGKLSPDRIRLAARRAGAPVAAGPAEAAAATLLGELSRGAALPAGWPGQLRELLPDGGPPPSDAQRAAAAWADATLDQRGESLWDLLLLADSVQSPVRRPRKLSFPVLRTVNT